MTEKDRIFMDVILAIQATRGRVELTQTWVALDEVEEEICAIAKTYGVEIPEPS